MALDCFLSLSIRYFDRYFIILWYIIFCFQKRKWMRIPSFHSFPSISLFLQSWCRKYFVFRSFFFIKWTLKCPRVNGPKTGSAWPFLGPWLLSINRFRTNRYRIKKLIVQQFSIWYIKSFSDDSKWIKRNNN